jgi:hypothetical protein
MEAELKIHRGCTIDHIEVAVHGESRPCKYHTIPTKQLCSASDLFHSGFLLGLFFDHEDWVDMFFRNVC